MRIRYFQSLFVKAVVVLAVISVVPVIIIGYRMMKINSRLLTNELLQKQQTIAGRIASSVHNNIVSKEQLLLEFGDLHTEFGSHNLVTQPDLSYLRQRNTSLFYLAVFSKKGLKLFDSGTVPQGGYEDVKPAFMQTCLQGGNFVSTVLHNQGRPFVWLAGPLRRHVGDSEANGVLVAAMYLGELHAQLTKAYPLDMEAVVVSSQGEVFSYNGALDTLDPQRVAQLQADLLIFDNQLGSADNAEVRLPDGTKVLVSTARVPFLEWRVYVMQPSSVVSQLLLNNLIHASLWDVCVVAVVMVGFAIGVSYLVIIPITRPLEHLRKAVVKLRENDDFVVTEADVKIPRNEIGELARVLIDMSKALYQRRQELIKTQQKLAQMNQELEARVEQRTRQLTEATNELVKSERLAAIGQMASIISHEIRNPLAVISNATRLIKTLIRPTDSKLIKQFSIIEAEIHQASNIINEVLGYARARNLILSTIEVNSYLHDLVTYGIELPAHVTLKEEFDAESVRIKVDAEEIKQALRNLIANALEAMPGGGTLTVGYKVGKRLVCLYVNDTGMGISEEIRREMFSPFFTTKARGTGLGLAIVRRSVSRHGGKLFIQSHVGKGTSFQIYLKIYRKVGDTNYGTAS